MRLRDVLSGLAGEWGEPRQSKIKQAAQRVEVTLLRGGMSLDLFGCNPVDRSRDRIVSFCLLGIPVLEKRSNSEIQNLHLIRSTRQPAEHDVCWLQIAMDQPGMMRAGEAVETLPRNLNKSGCIEWTGFHRSLQRLALNVFHDDVGRLAIHAQIVDRNNVGVP